ncbi:MAG: Ppx/GppA family phosphatase [Clostridia bacterium]|nr:Ppx/GppA family phosphatase [Clostridia bacterium]
MLAAIDLGTNSARLLIGKVENGKVKTVQQHRKITRMGAGIREEGLINRAALDSTASALEEFQQIMVALGVADVTVIATSAARRASNRDELARIVRGIFHRELRVLDGREEARLSYEGAVGTLPRLPGDLVPAVLDIGGGSVEICTKFQEDIQALSFEIGAVRNTETPISDEIMGSLLLPMVEMLEQVRPFTLVGVGGTVTTLAAMDQKLAVYDWKRIHGYRLYRNQVKAMFNLLNSLSLDQRKCLPGLEPGRADIIVAGTGILLFIMDILKTEAITVSEADLLHGALMELNDSN